MGSACYRGSGTDERFCNPRVSLHASNRPQTLVIWWLPVLRGQSLLKSIHRGKVFVFSGLLPICNGEDGLATVLGHEIAHNLVHHSAENYSRLSLVIPVAWLLALLLDISGGATYTLLDYAYNRPGSRRQEVSRAIRSSTRDAKEIANILRVYIVRSRSHRIKYVQFMYKQHWG